MVGFNWLQINGLAEHVKAPDARLGAGKQSKGGLTQREKVNHPS